MIAMPRWPFEAFWQRPANMHHLKQSLEWKSLRRSVVRLTVSIQMAAYAASLRLIDARWGRLIVSVDG